MHSDLEEKLSEWFCQACANSIPTKGPAFQKKAMIFHWNGNWDWIFKWLTAMV
jgi:hypothetical protein